MAYRDLNTLSVREQVQHKYARRAAKLVNVFQCLIVSANPERRRMLDRAASESGWKTHVCADAQAALAHVNRWLVQLAVVDLDAPSSATFRPLVEQLSAQSGLLSIVCGHDGDVKEDRRMRLAYLVLSLLPTAAVVTLAWYVVRAISVRVVWRETGVRPLDDESA
jgi:CheY-like chemotaxis protein